jgi:hypothetical protein
VLFDEKDECLRENAVVCPYPILPVVRRATEYGTSPTRARATVAILKA